MAATYEPIATTTLGSAQLNVTFSSIPSTYTDLILIIDGQTASNSSINLFVNSDSGSNYSSTLLIGNGSAASSTRTTSNTSALIGAFYTTSVGNCIAHFQNYSNTTTYKTILSRSNVAGTNTTARVSLWRNTAAISTIKLEGDAVNFSAGTTFTLYGIKAA